MGKLFRHLAIAAALAFSVPAFASTSLPISPTSLTKQFTSSGSDTAPSWATSLCADIVGGGGGGSGYVAAGAGGGGGGVYTHFCAPISGGATVTITVGAGGAGGAVGAVGGDGGTSSAAWGSFTIGAFGGAGGHIDQSQAGAVSSYLSGLGAYVPAISIFPTTGKAGANGVANANYCYDGSNLPYNDVLGGPGGCTPYGRGGAESSGAANSGTGYGSGGGGRGSAAGGGAAGQPGLVVLTYNQ